MSNLLKQSVNELYENNDNITMMSVIVTIASAALGMSASIGVLGVGVGAAICAAVGSTVTHKHEDYESIKNDAARAEKNLQILHSEDWVGAMMEDILDYAKTEVQDFLKSNWPGKGKGFQELRNKITNKLSYNKGTMTWYETERLNSDNSDMNDFRRYYKLLTTSLFYSQNSLFLSPDDTLSLKRSQQEIAAVRVKDIFFAGSGSNSWQEYLEAKKSAWTEKEEARISSFQAAEPERKKDYSILGGMIGAHVAGSYLLFCGTQQEININNGLAFNDAGIALMQDDLKQTVPVKTELENVNQAISMETNAGNARLLKRYANTLSQHPDEFVQKDGISPDATSFRCHGFRGESMSYEDTQKTIRKLQIDNYNLNWQKANNFWHVGGLTIKKPWTFFPG